MQRRENTRNRRPSTAERREAIWRDFLTIEAGAWAARHLSRSRPSPQARNVAALVEQVRGIALRLMLAGGELDAVTQAAIERALEVAGVRERAA